MKLSSTLLQAMALGITVAAVNPGCSRDDVKSGATKAPKEHKAKEKNHQGESCPACGMG